MNTVTSIVIGVAVLALLLYRQLQKRSLRTDRSPTVLLVVLVIGLVDVAQYGSAHPVNAVAIGMLAASLVVGAVFGAIRAYTVRLWRENGELWRQGTVLTAALWIVAIGVHYGVDLLIDANTAAKGLASAALLLYIAVSFGVQRVVVGVRAARLPVAAGPASPATQRAGRPPRGAAE